MTESYIEFTTQIGNGRGGYCVVGCMKYCPQELIVPQYKGEKVFTLEMFKNLMKTVPTDLPVFFSGRSEPFQNQQAIDMIEWVHQRGNPITIFSTLTGLTPEHAKRLVKVPVTKIVLHLPDPIKPCEYLLNNRCYVEPSRGYCPKVHFPFMVNEECGWVRNAKIPNHSPQYRETHAIIEDWDVPHECMDMGCTFKSNQCEGMARGTTTTYKYGARGCNFLDTPGYQVQPNGDVSFCCMVRGLIEIVGNLNDESYVDLAAKHPIMARRMSKDPGSICHRCLMGERLWIRRLGRTKNNIFNNKTIAQILSGE